jgi:hypothetical protein
MEALKEFLQPLLSDSQIGVVTHPTTGVESLYDLWSTFVTANAFLKNLVWSQL